MLSVSPERDVTDHTELELIFESYYADFEEIVAEIKTVKVDIIVLTSFCWNLIMQDTIEDTNQFISAHLDSVRNKMLRFAFEIFDFSTIHPNVKFRMSLMMEMGALALGSGAVVGGVFGMNLVSGLEEHPQGNPEFFCTIL